MKKVSWVVVIAGAVVGLAAVVLTHLGNPANMGFCIACFLRDTAGGLGLHRAAAVQYIRPEIIGLVLGSFGIALFKGEFSAKGGSAPLTRFVLGFFVMIGCLMFLGCPFRMILRLAGGDLNALLGGLGFVLGILAGVFFLKKGYSLKRSYSMARLEGFLFPAIQVVVFILLVALIFIMKAFGACFRVRPASGRKVDAQPMISEEEIAAIATALKIYKGALHDRESEVLTILNIKRAYSPWNSKIHGLTQLPDRR